MAFGPEIRFMIGASTAALKRGFVEAQSVAAAAGKSLEKKFGMKDAFKSTVLALGLSIEKIADKFAEMWTGGSQESWKAGLKAAEESARIIEESTLARMSTLRQIAELERQIRRGAGDENADPRAKSPQTWKDVARTITTLGLFSGLKKNAGVTHETEAEAFERAQKATAERLLREKKIDDLKEKRARDEARVAAARADLARVNMGDEQKALALQDEVIAAYDKVAEAIMKGKDATDLHVAALGKQKALEELLLDIKKKQDDEDKKRAREYHDRLEEIRKNQEEIADIEAEAAALGESTSEKIARLKNEAYEALKKSADATLTLQERDAQRVKSAEKLAQAAKVEYEWKNKPLSVSDATKTPAGRRNTTAQGLRAQRIEANTKKALAARQMGRYDEAARLDGEIRTDMEAFEKADRAGMAGGKQQASMGDSVAARPSAWDLKYGAQIAARNKALNRVYQPDQGSRFGSGFEALAEEAKKSNDHLKRIDKNLTPTTAAAPQMGPVE